MTATEEAAYAATERASFGTASRASATPLAVSALSDDSSPVAGVPGASFSAVLASAPSEPADSRVAQGPGVLSRFARAVRRLVVSTVLVAACGGVGLYFARPYMPAWMLDPVTGWLNRLPLPHFDGR